MDHNMEHLQMELDNETLTDTKAEYIPEDSTTIRVYLTVLFISSILSLISNGIVSLVILNYRRLRAKTSNKIILHWTIVTAIYLIIEPSSIRLGLDWNDTGVSKATFCIIEEIENALLLLTIFFVILLTKYWYYDYYNKERLEKLEKNFKYILCAIYGVTGFFLVLSIESCFSKRFTEGFSEVILFFMFMFFIIFTLIINIIHQLKKRIIYESNNSPLKASPSFILTNVFFVSYVPILVGALMVSIYETSDVVLFIFGLISSCNSIYNLFVLYKYDGDFNLFCKHILKCKADDYPEEFQPELDDIRVRY